MHQIFFWLMIFVFAFSMLGFIFDPNFKALPLSIHLVVFAVLCAACRLISRAWSDQGAVVLLVGGLFQVLLALYQQSSVWAAYSLGGAIYGICAMPVLYAIPILLGIWGVIFNLFVSGLLIPLAFQNGFGPGFSVIFTNILGTVMGYMFFQVFRDSSNARKELERNATTDALTQIGNRRALEQDFERYQAIGRRKGIQLVLSSWDVDGLKRINDERGHKAGDVYLMQFVRALQKATRKGDSLYRTGGDEFVGLHMGLLSGEPVLKRVRAEFAHVSVGFSVLTQESLDRALSDADAQMYAEKRIRKGKSLRSTGEYYARAASEDWMVHSTGIDINVHSTGIDISVRNTSELPIKITKDPDLSRLTLEHDRDGNKTIELDPRDINTRQTLEKPN
jgi:predicted signal transduction protein with EAL and GGDEF domain